MPVRFIIKNREERGYMGQKDVNGYTQYQKKVIRGFYDNKDARLIQKLGELVSTLYLETSEKKSESGWKRIKKMLLDLKVNPNEVDFLTRDKNLTMISKKLGELY
ncbi:MAG: hypothetical protein EX341_10390 [Candidatus Scalindua sp. SCAELEC01]|nr:hypothetical protein [Planctomycetota bacterium]RZV81515.1 MAG: hypothetical protein EX341_10390 [Candidatus Scalindua sp. SCAELEC01]